MSKSYGFLVAVFFIICGNASGQNQQTARDYLRFIDSKNEIIVESTWNYMYLITHETDGNKHQVALKKLERDIFKSIRMIEQRDAFDAVFQNEALVYLNGNLFLIKGDNRNLLKSTATDSIVVAPEKIRRKIRVAMRSLRSNYDDAVKDYATRYDLKVDENQNHLASQMQHAIAVYDYHYELRSRVIQIKNAERDLWQDFQNQSLESFEDRRKHLKTTIINQLKEVEQIESVFTSDAVTDAFITFTNFYGSEFDSKLNIVTPVLELDSYSSTKRSQVIKEFNTVKDWFNSNRVEAYAHINESLQAFLRREITALD